MLDRIKFHLWDSSQPRHRQHPSEPCADCGRPARNCHCVFGSHTPPIRYPSLFVRYFLAFVDLLELMFIAPPANGETSETHDSATVPQSASVSSPALARSVPAEPRSKHPDPGTVRSKVPDLDAIVLGPRTPV